MKRHPDETFRYPTIDPASFTQAVRPALHLELKLEIRIL
jgi:hypothetical protein